MGGIQMSKHRLWPCTEDENLLLGITEMLRAKALLGGSRWGAEDELMFLSGGPHSEFSSNSMLMGPSKLRVIARQPKKNFLSAREDGASPLKGEVPLGPPPPALELEVQEWDGTEWSTTSHHMGTNLAESLRTLDSLQPQKSDANTVVRPGAWAGALGYDLVQWTQPWHLAHPPEEGSILLILYRADRWLIHDRNSSTLHLISEDEDPWAEGVENLLSVLPVPILVKACIPPNQPTQRVEASSHSDKQHARVVERVKNSIMDGEFYQLNFGRRWYGELSEHPWTTMLRLCDENPAPMSGWLHSPDLGLALCCCSPELLLACDDGVIRTRPIKGTRPRGKNISEDEGYRIALLNSQKEMAEHRMLVDLERNDIAIVSKPGSVEQSKFQVEGYSQVQHIVSEVKGNLKEGHDVWNVLHSLFPGGSITGCPKTSTVAAIDELEQQARSFWTGSMGYVDPRHGSAMWNILIRTLEAKNCGNGWSATVQAGGGLVMGSDPNQEVEEAKWKAQALRRAAGWLPSERIDNDFSASHSIHPQEIHGKPVRSPLSLGSIHHWQKHEAVNERRTRILFIDNLDSFSWNIMHAFCELGADVIHCHGRLDGQQYLDEILERATPSHIVIGPGPGRPSISPLTMRLAHRALRGETPPTLGICLGHQALGIAAGMRLVHCPSGAVHGVPMDIHHNSKNLFTGFISPLEMTAYNSLVLELNEETIFEVSARDQHGNVMALSHPSLPVYGLQFHPESCASRLGMDLLSRFISPPDNLLLKTRG